MYWRVSHTFHLLFTVECLNIVYNESFFILFSDGRNYRGFLSCVKCKTIFTVGSSADEFEKDKDLDENKPVEELIPSPKMVCVLYELKNFKCCTLNFALQCYYSLTTVQ